MAYSFICYSGAAGAGVEKRGRRMIGRAILIIIAIMVNVVALVLFLLDGDE
jgi:hypothetical protein